MDPCLNRKELEHFQPLECIAVVELTIPKSMARETCNQDIMHYALRVDLAKLTRDPKSKLNDLDPFLFPKIRSVIVPFSDLTQICYLNSYLY